MLDRISKVEEVDLTHREGWGGLRFVEIEIWIPIQLKPTNLLTKASSLWAWQSSGFGNASAANVSHHC